MGTRAQGKGLGLGCQPPPPSHSRLEAGGGLHAGSAQCPAQALDLGQEACEGGWAWKLPAPPPSPPPTYLPPVEIHGLGLQGAGGLQLEGRPLWGLMSHPFPAPQSPCLCCRV